MLIGTEKSVHTVIDASIEYLQKYFQESTLTVYRRSYKKLKDYYDKKGVINYSISISEQFVQEKNTDLVNGRLSKALFLNLNRAVALSNQFFVEGNISMGAHLAFVNRKYVSLPPQYQSLLDAYEESMRKRGLKESSIQKEAYDIAHFLRYLQKSNINDIHELTPANVVRCIPFLKVFRQDIGDEIASVRRFLLFLVDFSGIDESVANALYVSSMHHKKIIYGFTNSEVERILSAVDRTSPIGMRDYAIMLMAHETGLRCIDIKNLRLTDIDWRNSEINIVSSKGQKPKSIKIMRNLGEALADYRLNGRPQSDSQYFFLSTHAPYEKLLGQLSGMVKKYAKLSGVDKETKAVIGMHAFRRGLGIALLEAETPLPIISELLDHSRHNTTKRYLAIDISGLEICAMPMKKFACEVYK